MKCGHPLSISVIAFITKMSSRGASHSISCSGNHWRNPRTDNKRSDRPQLTQVKSSFSRCLSASFCGIKSWQAFWPAGAQAGVGSWVGPQGCRLRWRKWVGPRGCRLGWRKWVGPQGCRLGWGWCVLYWRFLAFRSMELYNLQLLVTSFSRTLSLSP